VISLYGLYIYSFNSCDVHPMGRDFLICIYIYSFNSCDFHPMGRDFFICIYIYSFSRLWCPCNDSWFFICIYYPWKVVISLWSLYMYMYIYPMVRDFFVISLHEYIYMQWVVVSIEWVVISFPSLRRLYVEKEPP